MDGERIDQAIMDLCLEHGQGKTICPSEAARRLAGEGGDRLGMMGPVRQAAVRLAEAG